MSEGGDRWMTLPAPPHVEHLSESRGALHVGHQKILLSPGAKVLDAGSFFEANDLCFSFICTFSSEDDIEIISALSIK